MITIDLELTNKTGLHARPAAELVKAASKFKSAVKLQGNGKTADAKSIIMVLTMGLKKGDHLTITADGPDEKESIAALKSLVENKFNED